MLKRKIQKAIREYLMSDSEKKSLLKLYLNDVGLLTSILFRYNAKAVLDDSPSINLGSVYENVVASELSAHGYALCYYDSNRWENRIHSYLLCDVSEAVHTA